MLIPLNQDYIITFPTPFERVLTPKVTKVNRVDVGFRPASDTGRSSGVGNVPEESFNVNWR